jgi:hypothetical protein
MDPGSTKTETTVLRKMNLFPIYILGMLVRAWLFSGEGKGKFTLQIGLLRTDVMIFKIFSAKNLEEKWRFILKKS